MTGPSNADLAAAPENVREWVVHLLEDLKYADKRNATLKGNALSFAAELAAIKASIPDLLRAERERIIKSLRDEADVVFCHEDAMIVADCADLVECDFSYEAVEQMKIKQDAIRALGDA